ncbi:cytochrome P450 [Streptomyces sp. NPDC102360]|uniref:cytochrome P450 n=1 Tax=Streptomyces sp. NPDC102360 TaxID=3366160 RepID=UPI0038306C40
MTSAAPTEPPTDCPISDVDPFSDEFLADPFPSMDRLRESGEVFYLRAYDVWGVARDEQVAAVLRDHETFSNAAGIGYTNLAEEDAWRSPSLILEADPPAHTRTRSVVTRVLSPRALRDLKKPFEEQAGLLADSLVAKGTFDAVPELAEAFPLRVFGDALGLPERDRHKLLVYGGMTFNANGPDNRHFQEAVAQVGGMQGWVDEQCSREALGPDSFGAHIYAAVDSGELAESEAKLLVRSFLTAGVDTTVSSLGFAIRRFAEHPDQWDLLRADPSLARSAFDEIVRLESPVIGFFRTTKTEAVLSGATIPAGSKVMVFFAGANRDPRRWDDPERFDIRRRSAGHAGFGVGVHGCAGQMLARLEAETILKALATRVARWELTGTPRVRLNNTLRGLETLPVRAHPA